MKEHTTAHQNADARKDRKRKKRKVDRCQECEQADDPDDGISMPRCARHRAEDEQRQVASLSATFGPVDWSGTAPFAIMPPLGYLVADIPMSAPFDDMEEQRQRKEYQEAVDRRRWLLPLVHQIVSAPAQLELPAMKRLLTEAPEHPTLQQLIRYRFHVRVLFGVLHAELLFGRDHGLIVVKNALHYKTIWIGYTYVRTAAEQILALPEEPDVEPAELSLYNPEDEWDRTHNEARQQGEQLSQDIICRVRNLAIAPARAHRSLQSTLATDPFLLCSPVPDFLSPSTDHFMEPLTLMH